MKHVLIVEPDLASGMKYFRTFVVAGYDAEHVTSGAKALATLHRTKANAVVLNVNQRGDQARILLQTIRSRSEMRRLPIITYADEDGENPGKESWLDGATDFLVLGKSGAQDLLRAVERILRPIEEIPSSPSPEPVSARSVKSVIPAPARETPKPPALKKKEPSLDQPKPPPQDVGEKNKEMSAHRENVADFQSIRLLSQRLFGAQGSKTRQPLLTELHRAVRTFMGKDASLQSGIVPRLWDALASLLGELSQNPDSVTSSNLRTILHAVNSFDTLLKNPILSIQSGPPPFKVLAADDQPDVLALIRRSLATVGLEADGAKDAFEVLELAKQNRYDLFVLDINMPRMNGFELCEKLRVSSGYEETPVIFVTGDDRFDSRVRSASIGANELIAKPFLPKELALKALFHLLPTWIKRLQSNRSKEKN
ncbi:MAG: response regulator [Verrucomicrobia bacterium]|nr:response regulator [Verrucomicrobiota bacterium]